jgi:hypothetical protein
MPAFAGMTDQRLWTAVLEHFQVKWNSAVRRAKRQPADRKNDPSKIQTEVARQSECAFMRKCRRGQTNPPLQISAGTATKRVLAR